MLFNDDTLTTAIRLVTTTQHGSPAMLAAHLDVGPEVVAGLMECLEELHIVGPAVSPAGVRPVLMTAEQWQAEQAGPSRGGGDRQ